MHAEPGSQGIHWTTTFKVDGRIYLVQKVPATRLVLSSSEDVTRLPPFQSGEYLLATLVNWNTPSFDDRDLKQIKSDFLEHDDVWTRNFEEGEFHYLARCNLLDED